MRKLLTWSVLPLAAAVALLVLPAGARASAGVLVAEATHPGVVNLYFFNAPVGTHVAFAERVGDGLKALGVATSADTPPGSTALLRDAVTWRCDRLVRRFEATAVAPNGSRARGSFDVRTASCANRFKLSVPGRVALGAPVQIRVQDRWRTGGVTPRLCITPPRARRACRAVAFPRTVDLAARSFRATKRGLWRMELMLHGHGAQATVAVGGAHAGSPAPLPSVLVTGDSTMQGVDSFLSDRLARTAMVRSNVYPGSGISEGLDWLNRAAAQAKRYRPRTTVVSLGGADGFAITTPGGVTRNCCDAAWALEYRRRVRSMMKSYIRQGHGHVLWLTSPAPRNPLRAVVTSIVNAIIASAAQGLPGARILRLDLLLTPRGYREYMRYHGQTVRVREIDGVHCSVAGTAIEAQAIEKALRAAPGWL